jgi:hypothetical protein
LPVPSTEESLLFFIDNTPDGELTFLCACCCGFEFRLKLTFLPIVDPPLDSFEEELTLIDTPATKNHQITPATRLL